jgi:hypothetical protein
MMHLAGPPVQADMLVVQRCVLCGCRLVHEIVPDVRNDKSSIDVFSTGAMIWSETDPDTGLATHIPLASCEALELPYPNHHVLNAFGGMLCSEINDDPPQDLTIIDDCDLDEEGDDW